MGYTAKVTQKNCSSGSVTAASLGVGIATCCIMLNNESYIQDLYLWTLSATILAGMVSLKCLFLLSPTSESDLTQLHLISVQSLSHV